MPRTSKASHDTADPAPEAAASPPDEAGKAGGKATASAGGAKGGAKGQAKAGAAKRPSARKVDAATTAAEGAAPHGGRAAKAGSGDRFLEEQRALLDEERAVYVAQAEALKAEADQLAQEMEPGDIQFDDESGEGGTVNVDRERDLALSAQARVAVEEIDHAVAKIDAGAYGVCEGCRQPIPRARLKALPHARLCVACKSGGLSRR